jgi:trimeric autotransporter adhesin
MKQIISSYSRWKAGLAIFITVLASQALLFLPSVSAGSLSSTYVRLNRLGAGNTSPVRLVFTTASAGATSVVIDFSSNWTTNSGVVNATQTVSSGSCATDTSSTALPGSITAAGSGSAITISSVTALSATTPYCVDLTSTSAVTTPTAGSYTVTVTAGSDSTTVAEDIVGATADQIGVSATVNPSFTFSLSSNAAALGVLSAAGPTASSAINASVSTNAASGWQMWSADFGGVNAGLHSTNAGKTIAYNPSAGSGPATLSTGAEGYNLGAGTASGTTCTSVTTAANFASGGTPFRGGGLDGTLRSLAASTGVADACALPLKVNASISNTTPAATDYAGTITVVAAGLF